jgi:uncharacterized protein involved in type VI secretion and phage assembly
MTMSNFAVREAELEAGGTAKGVAVAIVRQNRDDGGMARVKVSYPWHSQPRESYWARIAVPMAGADRGTYFLPEIGDEVLVAFERGDLRFPYVIGALWNGVDKPPLTNNDGKNDKRAIVTRKKHKLTFDDGTPGKVQLELNDGKRVTLDDDGIEVDDGKGNRIVVKSNAGSIAIEAAQQLTLKAPQITIEATATLKSKAGATFEIKGALVTIN